MLEKVALDFSRTTNPDSRLSKRVLNKRGKSEVSEIEVENPLDTTPFQTSGLRGGAEDIWNLL